MLKNVSRMLLKINEKEMFIYFDPDLNTSEIKEAGYQLIKLMGQIEDNANQKVIPSIIEEAQN